MINRIGEVHSRLTIISFDKRIIKNNSYKYYWNCKCECGNIKSICYDNISSKDTKSCGCFKKEETIKRFTTHNCSRGSLEYISWSNMIERCNNPKAINYSNYGGRGITVCKKWKKSFINFLEDMGNKPGKEYSIDRIDSNGNYEPSNCKWSTKLEQNNNRCDNRKVINIITNKEYSSISSASKNLNMKRTTLYAQLTGQNPNKTDLKIKI